MQPPTTPEGALALMAAEMRRQNVNELVVTRAGSGTPLLVLLTPSRAKAVLGAHVTIAPTFNVGWRGPTKAENQLAKAADRYLRRERGEKGVKASYRDRNARRRKRRERVVA